MEFMFFAVSHVHKNREITVRRQQEHFTFDLELMSGGKSLAFLEEPIKHILINLVWLLFIYPYECSSACRFHAQMRHAPLLDSDVIYQVPKTLSGYELNNAQRKKLAPSFKGAKLLSTIMFLNVFFKIMSGKKESNLMKDLGSMCHGVMV